ncbi:hypothetical protein PVBG_06346 [Plasmodium vivax Brazil I]|uniref:Uncharacterized protein n=1 Tax=Plasmodium vivax (strain Brazil I) TaxID=1033975 RepID=A0A0J9T1C5_PLAV1|nr:hypothetical protein PVBG_06346 [Plasmodium vivax Brazil I]
MRIINNINDENVGIVESWLEKFKPNLKKYLNGIRNKLGEINIDVHCRDLNYILDLILERIFKLKGIKRIKWQHFIEEPSLNLLNVEFENLKCPRKMYNSNNNYMHIKKYMYDLCEDIGHIIKIQNELQKRKILCKNVISRVLERQKRLLEAYHKDPDHDAFKFDEKCTINYIMNQFSGKECDIVAKPLRAIEPTGNVLYEQQEQDPGPEAEPGQEDEVDPGATEELDLGIDIPLELPSGEEPKLDTTYAAASLCGVSLIGAMIYKVK